MCVITHEDYNKSFVEVVEIREPNLNERGIATESHMEFVPSSPFYEGQFDITDTWEMPLPSVVQEDLDIISKT